MTDIVMKAQEEAFSSTFPMRRWKLLRRGEDRVRALPLAPAPAFLSALLDRLKSIR